MVILHLMYAVRPMDTLTLGELSMRGSSSPRMVAEGNRKDGGARVDASDGSSSEGANPETGRQRDEQDQASWWGERATKCELVRSAHKFSEIICARPRTQRTD